MAYNVLKGNVEFSGPTQGSIESMVDDHSNQTIAGVKTFSGAITASMGLSSSVAIEARSFTGAGDGITGVNAASILITGDANNRALTAKGDGTLQAEQNFTFDGTSNLLTITGDVTASANISGSGFYGSAVGLKNIPVNQFAANISAADLSLGNGVQNNSGNLVAKLSGSGGLSVTSDGLGVDPNNAFSIGSLASDDEFLVADNNASNALRKATINNLQSYMQSNLTFGGAAGSNTQIQFADGAGNFAASNKLTFNNSTDILTVTGQLTASTLVSSSQVFAALFHGDGANLTNLPSSQLSGNISAANINIGNGLHNDSGKVAVSASYGLTASANGLEITASNTSGLDVIPAIGGIVVSPSRTANKASPVANDIVIIGDSADGNKAKNSTLTSIVTLMQNNGAAGSNTQVQFNSSNAFTGDNSFTFNAATNTLTFETGSITGDLDVQGNTTMSGTLKVNVDRTGTPLIALDKGESDTAEIEFKNNGITVAEIYSNAGESLFIRSVSLGINLRQGTDNVLNIDSSDTTFAHRPVTVNHNLIVTGSTRTASRFLNVSSSNANCTLGLSNEILMMINPQPATASLPSASSDSIGLTYTIKRTQAGEVEVSGTAGQTIDNSGATRKLTAAGEYIKLIATQVGAGHGWAIIGKSGSF